jgi:hypothetical protein
MSKCQVCSSLAAEIDNKQMQWQLPKRANNLQACRQKSLLEMKQPNWDNNKGKWK